MYFPIVIGICDIFMILPISIGSYTVNTVKERQTVVTPTFGKKFCTYEEL